MPTVKETIIVNAPVEKVFDISNQIELWPEMMAEYKGAQVLEREGRKIWFSLVDANGNHWTSWRMLYPPYFTCSERHEPRAPFKFMHLVWTYKPLNEQQTEMTWDMHFELPDDKVGFEEQWIKGLSAHTRENQAKMKSFIEARSPS